MHCFLPLWTQAGWGHLSLTGMMAMTCSLVYQSQLHPLGPASSLMVARATVRACSLSHLPALPGMESSPPGLANRLRDGLHAAFQPPSASRSACHSQGLSCSLGCRPLALPGRFAFSPKFESEIIPAASPAELGPPSFVLWKHFGSGSVRKVVKMQVRRPALPHSTCVTSDEQTSSPGSSVSSSGKRGFSQCLPKVVQFRRGAV